MFLLHERPKQTSVVSERLCWSRKGYIYIINTKAKPHTHGTCALLLAEKLCILTSSFLATISLHM